MKIFRYRLDALLRLKSQQLRQTESRLRKLSSDLRAARQSTAVLRQELRELSSLTHSTDSPLRLTDQLQKNAKYAQWITVRIQAAAELENEVARAWQAVRAEFQKQNTDVEALKSLREEQLVEYAAALERTGQIEMDELVLQGRTTTAAGGNTQ